MLLAIVAAVAICPTPAPSPAASPLKEIGHVRASFLCTALRSNIAQSIFGLRTNDGLLAQGKAVMADVRIEAIAEPLSSSVVGGAGAGSEMDDVRMSQLVHALAQNLDKIEALLADRRIFPETPASDDERALIAAKARLEAVAAEQRRALNILSGIGGSNDSTNLASKCDTEDCRAGGSSPARVSAPEALSFELATEQQVEASVGPTVFDIIDRCKKLNGSP